MIVITNERLWALKLTRDGIYVYQWKIVGKISAIKTPALEV